VRRGAARFPPHKVVRPVSPGLRAGMGMLLVLLVMLTTGCMPRPASAWQGQCRESADGIDCSWPVVAREAGR
jgi:hypothetical protein